MKVKLLSLPTQSELGCQHFLNMQTPTSHNMLEAIIGPTIGSIQIELEENFPPVNPHPKQSIGEVMYLAGQRSVVEWYNKRISKEDNG